MRYLLLLLLPMLGMGQVVINHPADQIPMEAVKIRGIDTIMPTEDGIIVRLTDGTESTYSTSSKPSPYCLCRGYDGKTFAQLGKTQAFINNNYPGLGLTVNDTRMLGEFLKCIYNNDKPIWVLEDGALNRGVEIPTTRMRLWIIFGGHTIDALGTTPFDMFYSPLPTSLGQAQQMASRKYRFEYGTLSGTGFQTGFRVGAGSGHRWETMTYENLRVANKAEYSMQGIENQPDYQSCDTGTVFTGYKHMGSMIGETQSNMCTINTPHSWTNLTSPGRICIGFYGVDGGVVNSPVFEGATGTKYAIDFDDENYSSVKNFTVNMAYHEATTGVEAYLRLKMANGSCTIRNGVGHTSGLLVDAHESGGSTDITIENFKWWVGVGVMAKYASADGMYDDPPPSIQDYIDAGLLNPVLFDTKVNGPAWTFIRCEFAHSNNYTQASSLFATPSMVSFCPWNTNCGWGSFTAWTSPR